MRFCEGNQGGGSLGWDEVKAKGMAKRRSGVGLGVNTMMYGYSDIVNISDA